MTSVAPWSRVWIGVGVVLGLTVLAQAAWAQSDPYNRLAIAAFEGREANKVRAQVIAVLDRQGYELVGARDVEDASGGDLHLDGDYAAVASRLQVAAIITGRVIPRGRDVVCEIGVRNGEDGRELEVIVFKARKVNALTGVVKSRAWESLKPALDNARPPSGRGAVSGGGGRGGGLDPAPLDPALLGGSGPEEIPVESVVGSNGGGGSGGRAPLRLDAGVGIITRNLSYNDDLEGELRPYSSGVHPTLNIDAEWYPAAHFVDGPVSNLGVLASYQHIFISASQTSDGLEFPTTASAYSVGMSYRFRFIDIIQLNLNTVYGSRSFVVEDSPDGQPKPNIPSVVYQHLDFGLSARVQIVPSFGIHAAGSYMLTFTGGEFTSAEYFPRADLQGAWGRLGVTFEVIKPLYVDLNVELERYFSALNSMPGDRVVAGGAVDQFILATLALSVAVQ